VENVGVDSVGDLQDKAAVIVRDLARKEREFNCCIRGHWRKPLNNNPGCVVVMTGVSDYVSDGQRVYKVSNGHSYLGSITGSGCMTGEADESLSQLCGI
jgi:thiamine-phosphate diphosphorylase/hydroxyethylthiazole kinase